MIAAALRMLSFMIVMPLLWIGLHVYMDRRLVGQSGLSARGRLALRTVIIAAAVGPVASMVLLRSEATGPVVDGVQLVGYVLMGLSSVALVLLVVVDLVRLAAIGWARLRLVLLRRRGAGFAGAPTDPTRRGFFGQLAHAFR